MFISCSSFSSRSYYLKLYTEGYNPTHAYSFQIELTTIQLIFVKDPSVYCINTQPRHRRVHYYVGYVFQCESWLLSVTPKYTKSTHRHVWKSGDCSIFRHPYVPTSLCSDTPLFRHPFVPTPLCSDIPMFRHRYVQTPLCSDNSTYIPTPLDWLFIVNW